MDDESEDANMLAAVKKLSEGEVSDLVKTEDDDYWVIRLDSEFDREATDEKKEEIVSDRQSDLYSEKLSEYSDAATWETKDDVIKKINFNTLYQMAYDEEATETAG
jgi:foldase protein PrsA